MANTDDLIKDEEVMDAATNADASDVSLDDMMAAAVEPTPADEETTEETPSESTEEATPEATEEESTDSSDNEVVDEVVEENAEEVKVEEATPVANPLPARKDYKGKWYIVHTYSGHENKVARTLMQRVQAMGFEERIYDALVPTRDTIRVRGGKKETIKEKIFPGYILVNMDLSDEAWVLVRTTPGVTSFVGAQNKPTPIRDDEVQAIVAFVGQKDPVYKAQFSVGEAVKITDGPFSDFLGTVESIDEAKGKIKVLVSIFGRETPVELDFLQVAKI
jgi:transcriptional antiterminator NusG